ncbi:MAG: hypothetical protein CSA47_02630, partial [Gammaproteobacteria bacterium]
MPFKPVSIRAAYPPPSGENWSKQTGKPAAGAVAKKAPALLEKFCMARPTLRVKQSEAISMRRILNSFYRSFLLCLCKEGLTCWVGLYLLSLWRFLTSILEYYRDQMNPPLILQDAYKGFTDDQDKIISPR